MQNSTVIVTPHPNTVNTENKFSSDLKKVIDDVWQGLQRWELWAVLGWHEIRQRYRRSVIGPFWITLSMGVTVGGMGLLYAGLFKQSIHDYLPFLALGFIVWHLIASLVGDSCQAFINSNSVIKQIKIPLSSHIYRMIWRNLIIFAHNFWIYVIVAIIFGIWPGATVFYLFPGLVLICLNAIWVGLFLGLISARFRDVPQIVNSFMQVLFFLTPVFWKAEQLTNRKFIDLNPFYHFIELVRQPLLGIAPSLTSWLFALAVTLGGSVITLGLYTRYRTRIAYWV